jgi:predicted nucleic acid-binding protein
MVGGAILVDSGVWIDFFNGVLTEAVTRLIKALEDDRVRVGDLILLEILQGFRHDADYERARQHLAPFAVVSLLGENQAVRSAQNYRILRRRGVTIRKTADVVIASYCIQNRLPLLYTDRDFDPFVEHLGLLRA